MDEYLFITLAKLNADRLQLERERAATPAAEPPAGPFNASTTRSVRHAPQSRWFSRAPQWRDQS